MPIILYSNSFDVVFFCHVYLQFFVVHELTSRISVQFYCILYYSYNSVQYYLCITIHLIHLTKVIFIAHFNTVKMYGQQINLFIKIQTHKRVWRVHAQKITGGW